MASAVDVLTTEEIRSLRRLSTGHGLGAITWSWGVIGAALAIAGTWPSVWTLGLAWVLVGGRQVALAVLMHEAAHGTLLADRRWNDRVGQWLCGRPVWLDLVRYRAHHLKHHRFTGTPDDPDLPLITPFPTTRWGLIRKLLRDVSGISGLRRLVGLVLIDLGWVRYTLSGEAEWLDQTGRTASGRLRDGLQEIGPVVATNAALALALHAAGVGWTWWIWAVAWLTTNGLFLRLRGLAEHAVTEISDRRLRNTRTTHVGWLARATVAPHQVAYHLEHHLLMTVPFHQLPRLHRLLRARGALDGAPVADSYADVLVALSSA